MPFFTIFTTTFGYNRRLIESSKYLKMRFNSIFLLACIVALSLGISGISYAGPGSGTTSPNPTGGFGQNNSTDPNPVGGIGTSGTDGFTPLSDPPPPPPDPVPLDGGMSFLLAATLGLGIKKIYSEVNKK